MDFQFSNNLDFKRYIKQKQEDIIKRTSSGIQENEKFKIFFAGLNNYLISRAFLEVKVLLIKFDHLLQISDDFYTPLQELLDSDDGVDNNYIIIDGNMKVVSKVVDKDITSSNEARKTYQEISTEGYIVFVLQPDALINFFINGDDFGEGIFLTNSDYNSFRKLKGTEHLTTLFEEYRVKLENRDTYSKFFLTKSHLRVLHNRLSPSIPEKDFIESHKHILRNKPEDSFREDLRFFLENHLKTRMIKKELVLNNFRRLDIFIWDESGTEMFLIEVKWVGLSVHPSGEELGTEYCSNDICPAAVHQSIDYLRQLHTERQNIKRAYLVVFDARSNDLPDTGVGINTLTFSEEEKRHLYKFKKVNDLKVRNIHPS